MDKDPGHTDAREGMIAGEVNSLLDELAVRYHREAFDPATMITASTLAARLHIKDQAARDIIKQLVKDGELVAVQVFMPNSHPAAAYRKP